METRVIDMAGSWVALVDETVSFPVVVLGAGALCANLGAGSYLVQWVHTRRREECGLGSGDRTALCLGKPGKHLRVHLFETREQCAAWVKARRDEELKDRAFPEIEDEPWERPGASRSGDRVEGVQ